MANKVGKLIREARTKAGLTQTALAGKITGLSASDLSLAERGEKELPQVFLREIAKVTGITQKSLLDAAASRTYKKTSVGASSGKSSGARSTSGSQRSGSYSLSASEKKLLELYRSADSETKKAVLGLLKDEKKDDLLSSLLGGAINLLKGK